MHEVGEESYRNCKRRDDVDQWVNIDLYQKVCSIEHVLIICNKGLTMFWLDYINLPLKTKTLINTTPISRSTVNYYIKYGRIEWLDARDMPSIIMAICTHMFYRMCQFLLLFILWVYIPSDLLCDYKCHR